MRKFFKLLIFMGIFSLLECSVNAEEYFWDYENYQGTDAASGWYMNQQIINGGGETYVSDKLDNNAIGFRNQTGQPYLKNSISEQIGFTWAFDVIFDKIPETGYLHLIGTTIDDKTRHMQNITISDGKFNIYNGNTVYETFDIAADTRYHIEYNVNVFEHKYSVYINSFQSENNMMRASDVKCFNETRLIFGFSENNPGGFSVDNMSFTTHNPDIIQFSGEDTSKLSGNYTVNEEKGNKYLNLSDNTQIVAEPFKRGEKSVMALKLKNSVGGSAAVGLKDRSDNIYRLDNICTEEWKNYIFIIENTNCSLYENGKQIKQFEISASDAGRLTIEAIGNVFIDDVTIITDADKTKGLIPLFNDLYSTDRLISTDNLSTGENNYNICFYDNREEKLIYAMLAYKKDQQLISVKNIPVEYAGNIGYINYTEDTGHNTQVQSEIYLWNGLNSVKPLAGKTIYRWKENIAPSAAEILESYKNKGNDKPYIVVTDSDFIQAKQKYNSADTDISTQKIKDRTNSIIAEADAICEKDFTDEASDDYIGYDTTNGYILNAALSIKDYAEKLGYAYRITDNTKYVDCLFNILKRVGYTENDSERIYPDWNPSHYLDTAQMTAAFSIAYSWGYDGFSDSQKEYIEQSIYEYGIKEGVAGYTANDEWISYKNNWGAICNSGMIIGALALIDKYPQECSFVISEARKNIENVLDLFNTDGIWKESIGYGQTSLICLINAAQSMKNMLGNDYGLLSGTGVDKSNDAYIYLDGPTGLFNYHDSSFNYAHGNAYTMNYLAKYFENDNLYALREKNSEFYSLTPTVYDILWYDGEKTLSLPQKDKYFSDSNLISFRSNYYDTNAMWIALDAGRNNIDHCHLDAGNFVFDYGNYRWALDLGYDDYTLNGYFGRERYNYYRVRAEGHNTLVINSTTGTDQKVSADPIVEKFVSKDNYAFTITDLTSAYNAESVRRGIYFGDNRTSITIRDELKLNNSADTVYWFMHTNSTVNIIGNKAILQKGKKKMLFEFTADGCDAKLEVVSAKPMIELAEGENSNDGIKKLKITMTNGQNPNLSVRITPYGEGLTFGSINTNSLDEWIREEN